MEKSRRSSVNTVSIPSRSAMYIRAASAICALAEAYRSINAMIQARAIASSSTSLTKPLSIGGLIESGLVKLVELDAMALAWIIAFMERYASAKAQMADAALMYIAEREGIDTVFTLDRRDFSIYRTTDGRALAILPER